jgi:predicted nucleic acid-binding Zn ribbon protein
MTDLEDLMDAEGRIFPKTGKELCHWCNKPFTPQKESSDTCSPRCGALLREAKRRKK